MSSSKSNQKWPVKWDWMLRYRLIETLVQWEGRLTANALVMAFGVGRQQASKCINEYIRQFPANLIYDPTQKGYFTSDNFSPQYTRGEADEYLQLLSSRNDLSSCFTTLDINLPNTEVLYSPIRNIRPEVIRPIVQAARNKQRVEIEYLSMSNPKSEGRVIAPHTLVWSGFRWHVRAYCEKNAGFRDFVLSRIVDSPEITLASNNPIEQDDAWNTEITISIRPDARLTKPQQRVIEADYGMQHGKLNIKTRGALIPYLLQILRIDPHVVQLDPAAQQIELQHYNEIKQWLF